MDKIVIENILLQYTGIFSHFIAYKMRKDKFDWIFPLVIAWALIGIGAKYLNDDRQGVWIAFPAFIIAGIIVLFTIILPNKKLDLKTKVQS